MKIKSLFSYTKILFLIIAGIHLVILTKISFFPYPELFIYSYLTKNGLIPYKEIMDQHFPGIIFFPVNLATLGIDTPQEARILHLGIVFLTHILLFLVGKKLFKSNLLSLASNLLYLIWQPFFEGYVLWIDSFMPLFLLPSFYFMLQKKKRSLFFLSGLFIGIALLFKQVVGPLMVLIIFYLFYQKVHAKRILYYLLGLAIPVTFLVLYITRLNVWRDFFYWTVTFNLTTFAQMGQKNPDIVSILKSLPLFGSALLIGAATCIKRKSEQVLLLLLFLIGLFVFALARFDFVHLQPGLPFAILLTLYLIKLFQKKMIFMLAIIYLISILYLFVPFYKLVWNNKIFFFGEFEQRLSQKVLEYANKGDTVFAMGTTPHLYYLTQTFPPGGVFVFPFPWFMKVAGDKILDGIIIDPPKVIARDASAEVQGMNLVEFMPKINDYVNRYYVSVDYVEGTEIMIWR